MPERKHYGFDILDYCYVYTLDKTYKMGLLSEMDKAYQVRTLFLRDEAKDFALTKELRNLDFDGLGERESKSERLFEKYCEKSEKVQWVYKNGDTGQQYLSIVYTDGLQHQWLFYPDYIVKMKNGDTWIVETKGGEEAGHSKNIDAQVGNKFFAFKQYAERYKVKWGFVRDMTEELFINNTEYSEEMSSNPNWRPLSEEF